MVENGNASIAVSGGSLTWTQEQVISLGDQWTWVSIWTATVDVDKTMSVTFTRSGNTSVIWGGNVKPFRDSNGIGASASTNVTSGAPSLDLATTQNNSSIVVANGDWNAGDGSTRTWRTVNGITPTAGNGLELSHFRNSSLYTIYGAYYSDTGTAGTKTVGLSAPSGQKYSIVAVEVLGTAASGSEAAGTSTGTSTATAAGRAIASAAGSAAGQAVVSSIGRALASPAGASNGSANVVGAGRALVTAAGVSAGLSSVTGISAGGTVVLAVGASAGHAAATAAGRAIVSVAGSAAGLASVVGRSPALPGPPGALTHRGLSIAIQLALSQQATWQGHR